MDIRIQLKGVEDVISKLNSLQRKQLPFATKNALNAVAFQTMREGRAHITENVDRVTRWPVQSWYVRTKATKDKLMAVVGWSDFLSQKRVAPGNLGPDPEWYLSHLWNGGTRKHKAFERQLQRKGLMPRNMYAVPGNAAAELNMIDRYGNMKSGALIAILSAVGSFDEMGYSANATVRQSKRMSASKSASKKVYWAGKPGPNTPNGIWMLDEKFKRGRGRLRPVIVFVRTPVYKKQLDLQRIAKVVEDRDMRREFIKAIEYAIRTAK